MNRGQNPARISIFWDGFGARFAPRRRERQAGMPGDCPQLLGAANTHLKMLKTKRLSVFQDGPKLPSIRQVANWRKWETLWVTGGTGSWGFLRHEACQGASNVGQAVEHYEAVRGQET